MEFDLVQNALHSLNEAICVFWDVLRLRLWGISIITLASSAKAGTIRASEKTSIASSVNEIFLM